MPFAPQGRRHLHWLVAVSLALFLLAANLRGLDDLSTFVGDETLWLSVSNKIFRLFWVDHRFGDPQWRESYATFGSRQPQISKYFIGLGTYAAGYDAEPFYPYRWAWDRDLAWNLENGGVPPARIVAAGRAPVAVVGVLAFALFYALVVFTAGEWTSIAAAACLVGAGLVTAYSRLAMIDIPALTFSIATMLGSVLVLRAMRQGRPIRALGLSVPAGLACGAAVGSKLNALLVPVACAAILAVEGVRVRRAGGPRAWAAFLCVPVAGACAWAVFYLSNPFLYGNAVGGVLHMLEMSREVAEIPIAPLHSLGERLGAVWDGARVWAPLGRLGLPLDRWLLFLGACALAATAVRSPASFRARQLDLISVWIVVSYVGTTLWLPHPWERYYLPLQPCNAFLEAYGVGWTAQTLLAWRRAPNAGHGIARTAS